MSEYWVSKKKYFCKYCDIYIADDVPSRQHHENGLRHKGNVERFVRGIYKAGEKQKKDKEEEKREMKRVEQAAAAAFAQDIATGIAKSSVASSSVSTAPKKPPPKPSNPYENYSTAASLGYTDPDADRLAEEMRTRQTQGVAGEWQVVTSTDQQSTASSSILAQYSNTTAGIITTTYGTGGAGVGVKRGTEGSLAEEDIRAFKLRKKQLTAGLDEIYDPGLIPIKVKKKEERLDAPLPGSSLSLTTESQPGPLTVGLTIVQLEKRLDQDLSNDGAVTAKAEENTSQGNPSSKWAKAKWTEPIPEIPLADRTSMFGFGVEQAPEGGKAEVKSEEPEMNMGEDVNISTDAVPKDVGGIKFKKRRAPMSAGRGRREI